MNASQGIAADSVASIAASLVNAIKEKAKEKRQLNLILHNVKESYATDGSKRKDEDACAVTSILKDYLDVTVSNTKCFWIGKKHDEPCLLKTMVSTLNEIIAVLKNKVRLRNQDNLEDINFVRFSQPQI